MSARKRGRKQRMLARKQQRTALLVESMDAVTQDLSRWKEVSEAIARRHPDAGLSDAAAFGMAGCVALLTGQGVLGKLLLADAVVATMREK